MLRPLNLRTGRGSALLLKITHGIKEEQPIIEDKTFFAPHYGVDIFHFSCCRCSWAGLTFDAVMRARCFFVSIDRAIRLTNKVSSVSAGYE